MKNSYYNSIIPLSEKTDVAYNALSDVFVFLNSNIKDMWNDFIKMKTECPTLYSKLCENGFYIEDSIDELELLQHLNQTIVENDKNYFMIINPTLACNYKCWYCYENHIPNSKMSAETLDKIYKHMNHVIETYGELQSFPIAFFGGEPLIYFKDIVLPIIRFHDKLCKENNISWRSIDFTSNGGLLNPEIIEALACYDNVQFQITLDGGKEMHNRIRFSYKGHDTYTLILRNVMSLLKSGIEVRLRINYTSESIGSLYQIADDLKDLSEEESMLLEVDFHQVWQERKLGRDLEGIREVVNYFIAKRLNVIFNNIDMVRRPCYGDVRSSIVVNYNGDIYKCTARDFNESNKDGYLDKSGNIIWIRPQEHRMGIRFKDGICSKCRIAPLCGGGCSRYMLEQEQKMNKACIYQSDERIDELILDRLDMFIRNRHKNG